MSGKMYFLFVFCLLVALVSDIEGLGGCWLSIGDHNRGLAWRLYFAYVFVFASEN